MLAGGVVQGRVVDRAAFEGRDALVLRAVVARKLRVSQGEQDGQQRDAGDGEFTRDGRATPGSAQRHRGGRAADGRGEQARVFLREHRPAGRTAHRGKHGERFAKAHDPTRQRHALQPLAPRHLRLAPRAHPDAAIVVAYRGRPMALALQQDAVAQRHAAELQRISRVCLTHHDAPSIASLPAQLDPSLGTSPPVRTDRIPVSPPIAARRRPLTGLDRDLKLMATAILLYNKLSR